MRQLLQQLLVFDPTKRINATDALNSPFLRQGPVIACDQIPERPAAPQRKSLLWAKGASVPPEKPPAAGNIRDVLRLSKSKTIDRLSRKKPSLTSIRVAAASITRSATSYDLPQNEQPIDEPATSIKKLDRAFDLPSIPALSPIQMCSDWNSGRTALVQRL